MLMNKLMQYRQYCESQYDATSRLLSMFRPRFDYAAKISVINKILVDHDRGAVSYSERDLDILRQGKLSQLLADHRDELPSRLCESLSVKAQMCSLS